ncbi:DUF1489 domain-containing protein [Devosia sp. XJ19-1]|uniref:DUF1489 domain-containing protein n=1 Tax=Devosia ureilytica TaxID=2952754 RepID=A0A9Q4ALK2_9HYPH|nr:DUF1489 domain-containing protein [Devosia ureilytica]MCP8882035.1 DUF1489 domain-containing protein [Devosia ureilytica]MCP8886079.1 DUF1489 domain-containing protein [Devosia ureilytica]
MIHMVKLCVGVSSVEELEGYREERAHWWGADYGEDVHVHRTRMMPKRGDEMEGQGSIYWVMSGTICCRQRILRLASYTDPEGKNYCDIIMAPEIVRTVPYTKRPFQGWRYLRIEDAPPDMEAGGNDNSAEIAAELARMGLI